MPDDDALTQTHDADRASLRERSRDELARLARERDVSGRSSMTKDELVEAMVSSSDDSSDGDQGRAEGQYPTGSRYEAFAELARARARGEMVFLPRMLTGNDRRNHVRQTVREDHEVRIANKSEDAQAKFDKLAGSLFSFFRGTCLLFYRDLAGEDAWMPTVLTLGDVHPENFGVMPSTDNVPIFGVNDFDEAFYAPFTWDLKRGAVGFMVAAEEEGGHGPKKQVAISREFVRGYVQAMEEYAVAATERDEQLRRDNAPALIADLIEDAVEEGRAAWLSRKYLDEYGRGFRADDEHVPVSARREEFQTVLEGFVADNDIALPDRIASPA